MTQTNEIHKHFRALWHRALSRGHINDLSADLISSWALERGLAIDNVEERDVGTFGTTRSVVLTVDGWQGCFPIIGGKGDEDWEKRRKNADHQASLWEKMEWFAPLWVPNDRIQKLLRETGACPRKRAVELFDYHMSTIYTLAFEAVCIAQLMTQSRSLRDYCSIAREAYLAAYSGYRASAIAALIPVIEGSLTKIVSGESADLTIPDKVDRVIDRAIRCASRIYFEGMWVPDEYQTVEYLFGQDERVFVFETFRRWLIGSFFGRTGEYDGVTWLNRHLFAHGASSSWQQTANFRRLVIAIATLGVIEAWHDDTNGVSFIFPEMNDDSTLLWQQALFNAEAQLGLQRIAEKRYHEHGRLVPEMPTDDGVLLRKAVLSEDCINDLVRPLRDAGWSIEVGEPDDSALFVTVDAKVDGARLRVALLYSCATDNALYRHLAETCDVILYRGAPYHQEQYAYGLEVYVGPVAGWQPPHAPQV